MRFYCCFILLSTFFAKSILAEAASATIAIVGPMSGPQAALGQKMTQAVSLYVDNFNQDPDNDNMIELAIYDDQGSIQIAKQLAQKIADEKKASVVISTMFPSQTTNLSSIYQTLKIPVLTGSAQKEFDSQNQWFFSTLFNNRSQGVFSANYLRNVLKHKNAHIIYNDDKHGRVFARTFELTFLGLGGLVKKKWALQDKGSTEQINGIIDALLMEKNHPAEILLLACNAQKSAEIIVELKRKGMNYKIFGTQELIDPLFVDYLSSFPEEQFDVGYFSDNVMATSPIIFDVAGKSAQIFKDQYQTRYNTNASWFEANYYDAANLAVSAINKGLEAKVPPEKLSAYIKNYLAEIDSSDNALDGLAGPLYFNQQGEVASNIAVGQFLDQKFISTYTQLDTIKDINQIFDLDKKIKNETILRIDNQYMIKTNIVFTGIDFVEISDLDLKTSTYTMDFYLWFRYQGKVNAHDIEFINQNKPITLGEPFHKSTENGITHEAYRIEASFRGNFDFQDYPFDEQDLTLQFHHKVGEEEQIFYVRDEIGLSPEALQIEQIQSSKTLTSWSVVSVLIFPDLLEHNSTFGDPLFFNLGNEVSYSRFNAQIHIKRNVLSFAIKNFLPLFIIMLLMYLVTFTDFATSISVYVGALLAIIFEHIRVSSELPGIGYTIALDYIFYALYILIVAQIIVIIFIENSANSGRERLSSNLSLANKIAFPVSILIGALLFHYNYKLPPFQVKDTIIKETNSKITTQTTSPKDIITISSWHTEENAELSKTLNIFNQKQTNFRLISKPIEYESYQSILLKQLKSNAGPDLFYLECNESFSQYIINHGYTLPLKDITYPLTDEQKRIWTSNGNLHAIPIFGIINGVYFNKDIFKKLNLAIPTTWEQFLTVAQKLKSAGYVPLANGTKEIWNNVQILFMSLAPNFIGGKNGRIAYSDGKRCFNDQHVVDTFNALSDLVSLMPNNHEELNYYDSRQLFLDKKAAMWINGSWEIGYLAEEKLAFAYEIFALPAPKGKTTTIIFYADSAVAISSKSNNPKAAKVFLEWLKTKEFAEVWQNNMPGSFSLNPDSPPPSNHQANKLLELTRVHPTDTRWILPTGVPDFYELLSETTSKVIAKTMTAKQAADYLQANLVTWYRPAQLCIKSINL